MRNVLKAALTCWYMALTMAFLFAAAISFMTVMWGFTEPRDEAVGAGALGLFVFGWGVKRYLEKFVARVEETQKNSDRFKDWDDEDDQEGPGPQV
jgi:hypothetical protein